MVSMVGCLEAVAVELGTGLRDPWESGLRSVFERKVMDTAVARGLVLGGKRGKQARTLLPWSLPCPSRRPHPMSF